MLATCPNCLRFFGWNLLVMKLKPTIINNTHWFMFTNTYCDIRYYFLCFPVMCVTIHACTAQPKLSPWHWHGCILYRYSYLICKICSLHVMGLQSRVPTPKTSQARANSIPVSNRSEEWEWKLYLMFVRILN